jgi:hypothetical protein
MQLPMKLTIYLRKLARATGLEMEIPRGLNPWIRFNGSGTIHQTGWFDPAADTLVRSHTVGAYDFTIASGGFPKAAGAPDRIVFEAAVTLDLGLIR